MEVTISRFRRDIFDYVNQAMSGREVWVTHKGRRFRVAPAEQSDSRLSRITPLQVLNPTQPDTADAALREEMQRAWESDWANL